MAYVREIQNKKGISYKVEVSNGYDSNKKKIRATTTFVPDPSMTKKQQKKALEKFVYEFEEKVKNGNCIRGEKITLEKFVKEWVDAFASNQLEKTTYTAYMDTIEKIILPSLGQMKLSKIRPYHIEKFYISLTQDNARRDGKPGGYSYGSICRFRIILSSILSSAEHWDLIDSNPCRKARLPKQAEQPEKVKCFTADQAKRFLKYVDDCCNELKPQPLPGQTHSSFADSNAYVLQMQYQAFFQIAIFGGLRRGEILALEWKNIDFEHSKIHIKQAANYVKGEIIIKPPKTKDSVRYVTVPHSVISILGEYQKEQDSYKKRLGGGWKGKDWLFIQSDGSIMHVNTPYNKFHKLIKEYNYHASKEDLLPVLSLHDLRHTNASLLVRSNKVDTKTISKKLGHSDMATTMKYYIHSYEESEQETAEILEDMLMETSEQSNEQSLNSR